jgi:hypothetical protein
MLSVTEPPDAATDEDEENKDNGESAENFVLPEVERLAQLGQFIAQALDLEVQVSVAGPASRQSRGAVFCSEKWLVLNPLISTFTGWF